MRILVTVHENAIARNLLRSGVFLDILAKNNHSVILVCPEDKLVQYQNEFGRETVTVVTYLQSRVGFIENVVEFLARNAFSTLSNGLFQERASVVGQSKVPLVLKKALVAIFVFSRTFKKALRFVDLRIRSSQSVIDICNTYMPDIVFSTALLDLGIDVPMLREARKRNIHTVGMTRSWDNLSSYGFVRIVPDVFLAQNIFLADIVRTLHDFERDRVHVVGDPYYDYFFKTELSESKEAYCARMGLDAHKKIILYAAIGDSLFPHEGELADVFESLIENGEVERESQVIFRAHPAFNSPLERMTHLKHVIPDRGAEYTGKSYELWDMNQKNIAHFINSIRHADVVVTSGSTVILDAVGDGKQVVSVAFDGLSTIPPLFSVRSYYERTTHLSELLKTEGFRLAYDRMQLAEYITLYLNDRNKDTEERTALRDRFTSPRDGHSAERIAKILIDPLI
jgi:hypothetical protein